MQYLFLFILSISFCFGQNATGTPNDNAVAAKTIQEETAYIDAMKEYLAENYLKSADKFNLIATANNKSASAYFMLAKSEFNQSKYENAFSNAKRAVDLDKENSYYWEFLADVCLKTNNTKETKTALLKAIKLKPTQRDNYFKLLQVYHDTNEPKEELSLLNTLESNFGQTEQTLLLKQQILLKQNKIEQALKVGNDELKNEPSCLLNQATILINTNKQAEAIELLNKLIKDQPNVSESYALLSDIYKKQNDASKAQAIFTQSVAISSISNATKMHIFSNFYELNKANNADELLLNEVNKLIAAMPNEAKPYIFKADILVHKNELKAAQQNYLEALKRNKTIFEAWQAVVELDMRLNQITEMEKHCETALEYYPSQAFFWYHSGFALRNQNKNEDALVAFDEAKNLAGSNLKLKEHIEIEIAQIYIETGKLEKAEKILQKTLGENPQNYQAIYAQCLLFLEQNQSFEKANSDIDMLLKTKPDDKNYLETKGKILQKLNRLEEAKIFFEKAQLNK